MPPGFTTVGHIHGRVHKYLSPKWLGPGNNDIRESQIIALYSKLAGYSKAEARLSYLDYVMDKIDLVLIMSVNPGFGGQSFIPAALTKLREARARIDAWTQAGGQEIMLQVDGGVKIDNIAEIRRAGADTFVVGSAIFGKPDYAGIIKSMREQIAIGETTAI